MPIAANQKNTIAIIVLSFNQHVCTLLWVNFRMNCGQLILLEGYICSSQDLSGLLPKAIDVQQSSLYQMERQYMNFSFVIQHYNTFANELQAQSYTKIPISRWEHSNPNKMSSH